MRRIRSRKLRFVWNIIKLGVLLGVLGALATAGVMLYGVYKVLPSPGAIMVYRPPEATRIYSSDGVLLARVYDEQNREYVSITEVSKDLQNATVAIEDARFYSHAGIDPKGVARMLWVNLRDRRIRQGGSTLTQQLARNVYLSHRRTVTRKLQEMLLAREIERRLSKQEILELYLNQIYYGSGAFGVKAAARTYFDKHPARLTLAESALLAGLPQRPSDLSPYEDKQAAVNRRNVVLNRMAELGYITPEQAQAAKAEKVRLAGRRARSQDNRAPYFVDHVVRQLEAKFGADEVHRGGLAVHTTLNLSMQRAAERALRRQVARVQAQGKRVGQGAVVALDPHTGHIKAMVGGLDYYDRNNDGMFNRVTQARRQPGSTFKLFVYAAAVENGHGPNTRLSDTPITFSNWSPRNHDGRFRGTVTIRRAVEQSLNIPAIRALQMVGADRVIALAQRMGIKSPLERDLSLALGTSAVSPLELASAYGIVPAGGWRAEPMAILRVVGRNGVALSENKPSRSLAIAPETAAVLEDMLRGVVRRGTGRSAGAIQGAGGKTGTTQELRDAWFVGFTNDLVALVWVGNNDNSPMGRGVFGGVVCAPVWVELMQTALPIIARHRQGAAAEVAAISARRERPEARAAEERQGVQTEAPQTTLFRNICIASGLLAVAECPEQREAGFPGGSEPTHACVIHGVSARQEPRPLESPDPTRPAASPAPYGEGTGSIPPGGAQPALVKPQPEEAPRVEDVAICTQSQRRASEYCPEAALKKAPRGQAPPICAMHGPEG